MKNLKEFKDRAGNIFYEVFEGRIKATFGGDEHCAGDEKVVYAKYFTDAKTAKEVLDIVVNSELVRRHAALGGGYARCISIIKKKMDVATIKKLKIYQSADQFFKQNWQEFTDCNDYAAKQLQKQKERYAEIRRAILKVDIKGYSHKEVIQALKDENASIREYIFVGIKGKIGKKNVDKTFVFENSDEEIWVNDKCVAKYKNGDVFAKALKRLYGKTAKVTKRTEELFFLDEKYFGEFCDEFVNEHKEVVETMEKIKEEITSKNTKETDDEEIF